MGLDDEGRFIVDNEERDEDLAKRTWWQNKCPECNRVGYHASDCVHDQEDDD